MTDPNEAAKVALEIGGPVVVRSQILAGKRGKGGVIKFADGSDEAKEAASRVLSMV